MCSDLNETYLKLFVLTQRFGKRIVLYISDADLLKKGPIRCMYRYFYT